MASTKPHPRFLIINVCGNDIAKDDYPLRRQQMFMKNVINQLRSEMPLTSFVWSHILPRLYWRHAVSNVAEDRSRYRINSSVAIFVLKSGGASIKYPYIRVAQSNLFIMMEVTCSLWGIMFLSQHCRLQFNISVLVVLLVYVIPQSDNLFLFY